MVHACLGGASVHEDLRMVSSGVHVLIGPPRCIFYMFQRRALQSDHIRMFVLDEADVLLLKETEEVFVLAIWSSFIYIWWLVYLICHLII